MEKVEKKTYSDEKSLIRGYFFSGLVFSAVVGVSMGTAVLDAGLGTRVASGLGIGAGIFAALVVAGFAVVAEVIQKRTGDF